MILWGMAELVAPKKKRRGNPDKWREYMRQYMVKWRAKQKVKPVKVPDGQA